MSIPLDLEFLTFLQQQICNIRGPPVLLLACNTALAKLAVKDFRIISLVGVGIRDMMTFSVIRNRDFLKQKL